MNKQLINGASSKLSPLKIIISESKIWADDNLDNSEKINYLDIESYNTTTQLIVDELHQKNDKNDEGTMYLYKFFYDIGIRGVEYTYSHDDRESEDEESEDEESEDEESVEVFFEIKARFKVIYTSNERLEEDCLDEFAKHNVGHNVWPYWREYVQSSCQRMGIKIIDIPFYKVEK